MQNKEQNKISLLLLKQIQIRTNKNKIKLFSRFEDLLYFQKNASNFYF